MAKLDLDIEFEEWSLFQAVWHTGQPFLPFRDGGELHSNTRSHVTDGGAGYWMPLRCFLA